jgi:hypothetical protein
MAEYVPLSEFDEAKCGPAHWLVQLPEYAPTDKIGVNLSALGTLARLGGFMHLDIMSYDGESDEISASPDGANKDGSTTATAKATITKAPKLETEVDNDPRNPFCQSYAAGYIGINTSPVTTDLSQKGALRNAEDWAEQLDTTIRKGLRGTTARNVLNVWSLGVTALFYVPSDVLGIHDHSYDSAGSTAATLVLDAGWAVMLASSLGRLRDDPGNHVRYSAVLGAQLDRLAAVYAATAVKKLVKPI